MCGGTFDADQVNAPTAPKLLPDATSQSAVVPFWAFIKVMTFHDAMSYTILTLISSRLASIASCRAIDAARCAWRAAIASA